MAIRRSTPGCLFCLARQCLVGRRRISVTAKQRLGIAAARPVDDGFLLSNRGRHCNIGDLENTRANSSCETLDSSQSYRSTHEFRDALLDFETLCHRRDKRVKVLRTLSNPWPDFGDIGRRRFVNNGASDSLQPVGAHGAPVPHAVFREKLKSAKGYKSIRQILRFQLLRCEWPQDVLRVIAVAMSNDLVARNFASLCDPIIRACYRCRNNVADREVLKLINIITNRLTTAGLHVDPQLICLGLKFAARVRSLSAMKKYLHIFRQRGLKMSGGIFRSIIAKCSIGYRGYGEVRNGRWNREQLMQVLTGFEDCIDLPPEQQFHLETFLRRKDWQYLHGWVAILARCKASDRIWQEWQRWKESPARMQPKILDSMQLNMTSEKRGYYWFIEQMTLSGDLTRAWQLVKETGLPFHNLKTRITFKLLETPELATVWDRSVRDAMIAKYARDLGKIEDALGIKWVPVDREGNGAHELAGSQEEALEKLSAEDWKSEEDYGFPYEAEGVLVSPADRTLHEAKERGLA